MQNFAESSLLHDDLSKGERTRAALVTAAVRRFAIDGYQRTSVSDVARDVGMTAGAPYRYFPDKESLFLAAVDADGAEMINLVRSGVFSQLDGPVSATLGRLTDQLSQALQDHPLIARVLSGKEPMGGERIHALPNLAALRTELANLLRLGQEVGMVRSGVDPAVLALGIETAVLYQLAHIASLLGSNSEPDHERWAALATLVEVALEPCPGATASGALPPATPAPGTGALPPATPAPGTGALPPATPAPGTGALPPRAPAPSGPAPDPSVGEPDD